MSLNLSLMVDTSKKTAIEAAQKSFDYISPTITDKTSHVIVLGGDGFMLSCLQMSMNQGFSLYGINFGTRGFLMNDPESALPLDQRITNATTLILHPLHIHMKTWSGEHIEAFAFNEMALLRASGQAVKVCIKVDNHVYLNPLMGDGVILCTPMGSGAYNYAAQGPMVPLSSNVLPLTPMNPCNPRRWPGALLPNHLPYEIDVLEPEKRPAQISIDGHTYVDIVHIHVHMSHKHYAQVLFDPQDTLNERLLKYQFDL